MAAPDYFHCSNRFHDQDSPGRSTKVFFDGDIDWAERGVGDGMIKVVALCPTCATKVDLFGRVKATGEIIELDRAYYKGLE